MTTDNGLVFACLLDGAGGGTFGGWDLLEGGAPEQGFLWVHLDLSAAAAREWLEQRSGLDELTQASFLADRSRPRALARGDALLVQLRGVNLNPGADLHDMISIRILLQERRVVTARRRRLMAVQDLRQEIESGNGSRDSGEFLVDIGDKLLGRMVAPFEDLDDRIDAIDDRIDGEVGTALRSELSDLRAQVIALRRYLAPQRDALAQVLTAKVSWLTDLHREHLREIADRTTRRVEDLEAARDRAGLAHEELTSLMAEQMNRTMYMLALVAAIFLPLGLITGLLGINVDGMPGAQDAPSAFWIVCLLLGGLAIFQWWLFKRMKWL